MNEESRIKTYLGSNYKNLQDIHCTIIGLGTLGSKTAKTLGKIGTNLHLIDRDFVEERNIDNQEYTKEDVGELKTEAMQRKIKGMDSEKSCSVSSSALDINPNNIENQVGETDVLIDSTDNLKTRLLLNDYAKKEEIPLIIGMIGGARGMTMTVHPEGPCLRCTLGEEPASQETCDQEGISPGIAEVISALQANQLVKLIEEKPLTDLLTINLENMVFDKLKTKKRKNCSTCEEEYKELDRVREARKRCSEESVQLYPRITDPEKLEKINPEVDTYGDKIAILENKGIKISVYSSGKAIVKGVETVKEAREKYDELLGGR